MLGPRGYVPTGPESFTYLDVASTGPTGLVKADPRRAVDWHPGSPLHRSSVPSRSPLDHESIAQTAGSTVP